MGSLRERTRILGLDGYRVERLEWEAEGPRACADLDRTPRDSRLSMFRVSPTDVADPGYQGADVGRSAVGRARRDPGLFATPRLVSNLRHPHQINCLSLMLRVKNLSN